MNESEPESFMTCVQTHYLIDRLPTFTNPDEVPFRDGLYLFYEQTEQSAHVPSGRIVRVGNHPRSAHRLRDRLWDHYSPNKNFSVFRKFLGGALLRRDDPDHPCLQPAPGKGHWEKQDAATCELCQPLEERVTHLLHDRFRFRCLAVEDQSLRNLLERKLIGSLSLCPVCRPSSRWLGQFAYSEKVRQSGLWNSNHVGGADKMKADDLTLMEELVRDTLLQVRRRV